MAEDIELSGRQTANVEQAIRDLARVQGVPVSEVKLTENSLKELAKSIADGTFKAMEKTNKVLETNVGKLLTRATKEQKEMNESLKGKFSSLKWWAGQDKSESGLTAIRRAENITGGIEAMFSGNFMSGLKQFGTAIPQIANFMGGPLFIGMSLVARGLLKLDGALAKATKTATLMSGGLQSNFVGNRWASVAFNANLKNSLYDIGMQGEFENIANAMTKNYGIASYKNNQKNIIESMAYAQSGLGAYGISADQSNSLVRNLRLLEGKNETGVYAQLKRLQDRFQKMSIYSPEEALKQASSLYSQSKNLGVNFEWASKQIKYFEKSLELGTRSMSDFAAVNRSLFSGGVKQNAGIAGLVTDFAARSGVSLPSSFLNQNIIGQSFSLSMPNLISNPNLIKAYSGQLNEMIQQMGDGTREEQAGMLQMILQSRGINVTSQAALDSITSSGVDLEAGGIMGKKAFARREQEQQQAEKYQELVKNYYKGTTPYHKDVLTKLDKLINNTTSKFAQGATGNVQEVEGFWANAAQATGYFISPAFWENVMKGIDKRLSTMDQTRIAQ
jgi:hypothetical protein